MGPQVSYYLDAAHLGILQKLPWDHEVGEWRRLGVRHLDIKRGAGRHPVIFIRVDSHEYVIKELGIEAARREIGNYRKILERGVHTLVPVGYVVREEGIHAAPTPAGVQYETYVTAHSVTLLMDRVLPDSFLYRRAFKPENRNRIWD